MRGQWATTRGEGGAKATDPCAGGKATTAGSASSVRVAEELLDVKRNSKYPRFTEGQGYARESGAVTINQLSNLTADNQLIMRIS